MSLKSVRISKRLTQEQVADLLGITRRTYIKYEKNEELLSKYKLSYIYKTIEEFGFIDEEHGILDLNNIKIICNDIFDKYEVNYAYLFGSYAKGKANENSDVDILISLTIDDFNFYEIIEILREKLKKKVDLLDVSQLYNNATLLNENNIPIFQSTRRQCCYFATGKPNCNYKIHLDKNELFKNFYWKTITKITL